jgi:hypothetical protein
MHMGFDYAWVLVSKLNGPLMLWCTSSITDISKLMLRKEKKIAGL